MSKVASKMSTLSNETIENLIERTQSSYFNWLCHLVVLDDHMGKSYLVLAKILHNIEVYTFVPNDDNREKDGIRLRDIWLESMRSEAEALGVGYPGWPAEALNGPCTMLELMVGLSCRIEADLMQDASKGNRTPLWFWRMLVNMTDADVMDDSQMTPDAAERLRGYVRRVLDRTYSENGKGGLFPLEHPERDQREVEIWYQMQAWIREVYL